MPIPLEISASDLARRIDKGLRHTLIDVRHPKEFAICQIPDSLNFFEIEDILDRIGYWLRDGEHPVIIVSHHGKRAREMVNDLRDYGYQSVCSLAGGIDAWAHEIERSMTRYD